MKKAIALLGTFSLCLAMAGCGNGVSFVSVAPNDGGSESSSTAADSGVVLPDSDGYAEGRLGDVMRSYFFDFTVNSAYTCTDYNGYTPAEGNQLLVANLTIKNTSSSSIEMYDSDFQAQWGGEGDQDYSFPITFQEDGSAGPTFGDSQLESVYTLAIDEEITGDLVFEVPAGMRDFSVSYLEYFSDDSTGDLFAVYFTATPSDAPSDSASSDSASGSGAAV